MNSKEQFFNEQMEKGALKNYHALQNMLANLDMIMKYVESYERIYIYGDGVWGEIVANLLTYFGMRYEGFVISDGKINSNTKMFHPVIEFSQLKVDSTVGIIVGIRNKKSLGEVIRSMQNCGIYHYMLIDELCGEKLMQSSYVKFSILMPVYNVNIFYLEKAINSIRSQSYSNWELCLVDDASTDKAVKEYLKEIADNKIKIAFMKENSGISMATNRAAQISTGNYLVLMDDDDLIAPNALSEFYNVIKENGADIIYSDQDIVDADGNHFQPLYKPDWSPDLLLCQMYIGHLLGFKRELFEKAGGFRKEYDGSQDYDLMLRMAAQSDNIVHVNKILYSWRSLETSTATNAESKPYAQIAGKNAIQDYLDVKLGKNKATVEETDSYFVYDVHYSMEEDVLVSIIIPTKDHWQDLKKAIDSIYLKSSYKNFEIIILNNNSEDKETYKYFKELEGKYQNLKIIDAFYEFNWSKLCNHGIAEAKGDVFIMLNNDVEVYTADWMERLASYSLQDEVGVVGALLLYEDGTIQHAGVLAGFGGWADHIFKGMKPVHYGSPFISPMVTRNVTAVTGACMAFSKKTFSIIGEFDESFVICGSDVELCIRAIKKGLRNVYLPFVRLMHYESKSREGIMVPEIDHKLGYKLYASYREKGDPYYNNNLSYNSYVPVVKECKGKLDKKMKDKTEENVTEIKENRKTVEVRIGELKEIKFRKQNIERKRINVLIPSICEQDVFGGIATALRFFEQMVAKTGYDSRIILVDREPDEKAVERYGKKYDFVNWNEESIAKNQIVSFRESVGKTLAVRDEDYFIVTAWWTALYIQEEYKLWKDYEIKKNPIIYFIQDFEPGFYPWSTQYLLADATYRTDLKQIAVFNSSELQGFFEKEGYQFEKSYYFEPKLNHYLKEVLFKNIKSMKKKKQVIIYGRPGTPRNAFTLVVEALKKWAMYQENVEEWSILSAGETHDNVNLGNGMVLRSLGKLSIEEYANLLTESYAGISLMVSPHPSYPPLEMAAFGIRVITNTYANKNLGSFSSNILSVREATPNIIGKTLCEICHDFKEIPDIYLGEIEDYCREGEEFGFINELIDSIF